MAACPVSAAPLPFSQRRPLALTQRRLAANRRNATRSTGPRTAAGKARVASNAIKHGFFVATERWTPAQQGDFATLLAGLRDDFRPDGVREETCVRTLAESYVRMASVLKYENVAALRHHRRLDRALDERIAAAGPAEAAHLEAGRWRLREAGQWRPTLPDEREGAAIIRYLGCLERGIRRASSELENLKTIRIGGTPAKFPALRKSQKQSHFEAPSRSGPKAAEGPLIPSSSIHESAKTNPLSSMFTGNRHQRRREMALARRR